MQTIIKRDQFREMPWKNGLGVTKEIDIYPVNADFTQSDFHWRLSSAVIKTKNSFSLFPGYQRILIVLEGIGMKLNDAVLPPLTVYAFSGYDKIECSPIGGDVTDLGIIYKSELYNCDMQLLTLSQETKMFFGNGVHYLKAISGEMKVGGVILDKDDFFKIEGSEILEIEATTSSIQFLRISLRLKSTG